MSNCHSTISVQNVRLCLLAIPLIPSCCDSFRHRIYCEDKHSFLQDCEDDGETAAGGRLLHLLQVIISLLKHWPLPSHHTFSCILDIGKKELPSAPTINCWLRFKNTEFPTASNFLLVSAYLLPFHSLHNLASALTFKLVLIWANSFLFHHKLSISFIVILFYYYHMFSSHVPHESNDIHLILNCLLK